MPRSTTVWPLTKSLKQRFLVHLAGFRQVNSHRDVMHLRVGNYSIRDRNLGFRQLKVHDFWTKHRGNLVEPSCGESTKSWQHARTLILSMAVKESANRPCAKHQNIARLAGWW